MAARDIESRLLSTTPQGGWLSLDHCQRGFEFSNRVLSLFLRDILSLFYLRASRVIRRARYQPDKSAKRLEDSKILSRPDISSSRAEAVIFSQLELELKESVETSS